MSNPLPDLDRGQQTRYRGHLSLCEIDFAGRKHWPPHGYSW